MLKYQITEVIKRWYLDLADIGPDNLTAEEELELCELERILIRGIL